MSVELLRAKECARRLGIGLSTWWAWVAQGKLPDGIKFGNRVTVWPETVLDAFIAKASEGTEFALQKAQ